MTGVPLWIRVITTLRLGGWILARKDEEGREREVDELVSPSFLSFFLSLRPSIRAGSRPGTCGETEALSMGGCFHLKE